MEQDQQTKNQNQTENVFTPTAEGGNKHYWWGVTFFALLALVALVVFSLVDWNQLNDADSSRGEITISGQVAITGIDKSSENSGLVTYSLDFNSSPPKLINQTERMGLFTSSFLEFIDRHGPGGLFFKTLIPVSSVEDDESVEEVVNATYLYDHATNRVTEIIADTEQGAGTMSVSQTAGLLAYSQLAGGETESEQVDSALVSNWEIVITNLAGEPMARIENAAHPAWLLDGSRLLYLKQEGLYALDWLTKEETFMYSISNDRSDYDLTISTMFDVTDTGNYMVITPQGSGKIYVLKVDWPAEQAEVVSLIDSDVAMYSWPVISPNNDSYAVIASRIDAETDSLTQPQVEIRSFTNSQPLTLFPLDDFDVNHVFLDDWVNISSGR